ncbi:hypothetical protein [Paenibacillus sp. 32352]|uniref:hypothetical protein n=1 Tax=Paenibacillus sp. 32352 TaxID=1969111 RepID=UPI0009AEDB9E|nr:hypothetical protein [Paenibacillus sp. 32352]
MRIIKTQQDLVVLRLAVTLPVELLLQVEEYLLQRHFLGRVKVSPTIDKHSNFYFTPQSLGGNIISIIP